MDIQTLLSRYEINAGALPEGVALINRNLRYVAADAAFCRAMLVPPGALIGLPVNAVVSDEVFDAQIQPPLLRCLDGERQTHPLFLEADGGQIEYAVTYVPSAGATKASDQALLFLRRSSVKAQSFELLLQYVEHQQALDAIDRATVGDRPLETLAALALEHVAQIAPCRHVAAVLTDEALVSAVLGDNQATQVVFSTMNGKRPSYAKCLAVGRATELGDVHSFGEGLRLALRAQGEQIGELIVQLVPGFTLDSNRLDLLIETAGRLERALQHTLTSEKLHRYTTELEHAVAERTQEVERRRQAAEGLREILRFLNANRPLGEILNHVFKQAELLLGADAVAVFSPVEPANPVLGLENQIFVHSTLASGLHETDFTVARAAVLEAVSDGKAIVVVQPANYASNYRAHLVAPLHAERGVSGVAVFFFANETSLAPESMDLAAALGEQVVLATESERLQQRAQEAALLEERERLARELHDAVTQSIYSLTLFAEAGRRLASAGQMDRVQEYLTLLGDTAQQAMKQMRLMLYELRPAVLEQIGLVDALRQRLEAVEQRAGISARLEVIGPLHLSPATEESLYRICQEALNNALKHASATEVIVRLTTTEDAVTLEVLDDGIGFILGEGDEIQGPGLNHIREQASRLNAVLTIQTAPNHGTTVRVSLVVPDSNAAFVKHVLGVGR